MLIHNFFRLVDSEPSPVRTNPTGARARASGAGSIFDVIECDYRAVLEDHDFLVFVVGLNPSWRAYLFHEERNHALLNISPAVAQQSANVARNSCRQYRAFKDSRKAFPGAEAAADRRKSFWCKDESLRITSYA